MFSSLQNLRVLILRVGLLYVFYVITNWNGRIFLTRHWIWKD